MLLIIFKKVQNNCWQNEDRVLSYRWTRERPSGTRSRSERLPQGDFLRRKLKKVSEADRRGSGTQDLKSWKRKGARVKLLETQYFFNLRSDWPFSNEAQETGSREKHPASGPKLSFFVRSGNIPEKGSKQKRKTKDTAKADQEAKAKSRKRRRKRRKESTEGRRFWEFQIGRRGIFKENCGEPQGKFITESGWGQWVAKHSSILSAAHCASDNI